VHVSHACNPSYLESWDKFKARLGR
jgi:hypothetical protein